MTSKTHDLSKLTLIPSSITTEAGRLIPRQELQQRPFWEGFKERDRTYLEEEIRSAAAAKLMHVAGGLALGKHLSNIYVKCEAYTGTFRKIVVGELGMVLESGYRYIRSYENAKNHFPEQVLKEAVIRGLDLVSYDKKRPLGKYTEVYRLLPPPSNPDSESAKRYLDQFEQTYKERKKAKKAREIEGKSSSEADDLQRDPKLLHIQLSRGIKNAMRYVPKRQRDHWFRELIGFGMHDWGYSSPTSFEPMTPPEKYQQGRGRPSGIHEVA